MELIGEIVKDVAPEFFVEGRAAAADQEFEARLCEWEFKIELQKLWREDIRDLVELTVGRMDVCHLVGALLLEFCISFYVKNTMLEEEELLVPLWILALFLLSNVTAVGYLFFAVWLAMHASVASHSIGVRLLTAFARLSIPGRAQLDGMRTQVLPIAERLKQMKDRWMGDSDAPPVWAVDQAFCIGSEGEDAIFRKQNVPLLDPTEITSLRVAVERLNDNSIPCEEGTCVVWSNTTQRFYVLYRSDAVAQAHETFKEVIETTKEFSFTLEHADRWKSNLERKLREEAASCGVQVDVKHSSLQVFDVNGVVVKSAAFSGALTPMQFPVSVNYWQAVVKENKEVDPFDDDQFHFRRFLNEQQSWLRYDAYARVCMTLGVNQMLQALSYFIIGVVAKRSPTAALTTIAAVQWLALLMLRLDMQPPDGVNEKFQERLFIGTAVMLPPGLAGILVWLIPVAGCTSPECLRKSGFLATPCFLLHICWYMYVIWITAERNDGLPSRLRTVFYINVLQVEQRDIVSKVRIVEVQNRRDFLQTAHNALQDAMLEVQKEEAATSLNKTRRRGKQLEQLVSNLRNRLGDLQNDPLNNSTDPKHAESKEEARKSMEAAERELDRFDLWCQAPEILMQLESLRRAGGWMPTERKTQVDRAYANFISACKNLDLGIVKVGSGKSAIEAYEGSTSGKADEVVKVDAAAMPVARVEAASHDGSQDVSAYVVPNARDSSTGDWMLDKPVDSEELGVASFVSTTGMLPAFTAKASQAKAQEEQAIAEQAAVARLLALDAGGGENSEGDPLSGSMNFGASVRGTVTGTVTLGLNVVNKLKHTPDAVVNMIPEKATPPEKLPGVIVYRFTAGAAVCWGLATVHHLLESGGVRFDHHWWENVGEGGESHGEHETEHPPEHAPGGEHETDHPPEHTPHFRLLRAEWPSPRGLFEVDLLHCDLAAAANAERRLFVGNRFGLHSAQLSAVGAPLRDFEEVSETGDVASLCCDGVGGCQALRRDDLSARWSLVALGGNSTEEDEELLPVPSSWRIVTASFSSGGGMSLAAWDGTEVIIADAERTVSGNRGRASWQVLPRLAVHPRVALQAAPTLTPDWLRLAAQRSPLQNYSEVRALQLGDGGRTLAVLAEHNGRAVLDGWDLSRGELVGRWALRARYSAMCHDGSEIYLASRNDQGAVLLKGSLPRPLRDLAIRLEL